MSEWQPIETAPKNKAVIACDGSAVGEACLIQYEDNISGWYWASDRSAMLSQPSHWMPLPSPPEAKP